CSGAKMLEINPVISTGDPDHSVQWSVDLFPGSGIHDIPGATSGGYSPTQSGNYFCTVNSACGTQNAVYTPTGLNYITITILPLPTATISGSSTICPGSSTTLNANTGTGLTYQW